VTLTVTAAAEFVVPVRVLVEVASSPSVTNVLRVYRVHADGSRNRVLTAGRALLNGTWSGYDYHAPFNESFTYVASTGVEADSAPSSALFIPSDEVWLLHPSDPALSVLVDTVTNVSARKLPSAAQAFKILGSPVPVMRTNSTRGPQEWDLEVLVDGQDETDAVEALFDSDLPIYINSPRSDIFRSSWVQPGDVSIEPPGGYFRTDLRLVSFSCTRCAPPDVDVLPVWTYADASAEFTGAYTTADGVWASYGDSRIDRRA
jgi:hypothetical protein